MNVVEPATPRLTEAQRQRIAKVSWFHHIQLGDVETPGASSKAHLEWIASHLPQSLEGKSVLDIGAWDGYFSFLAERRGARRVLAVDELQNADAHNTGTAGFELAKEILRSRVEYRVMSASKLDEIPETFDVILFLGVYYHVKDPIHTLATVRRRLRPGGKVYLEGIYVYGGAPNLRMFNEKEVEPTTFCAATLSGIERMSQFAGFRSARLLSKGAYGPIRHYLGWAPPLAHAASFFARVSGHRGAWPRAIFELAP